MKRQNKLDDGLNRLFSSAKRSTDEEQVEKSETIKEEPEKTKRTPKKEGQKEVKAPPKSHLIPVPEKPTLPLQIPFTEDSSESDISIELEDRADLEKTKDIALEVKEDAKKELSTKKETKIIDTNESIKTKVEGIPESTIISPEPTKIKAQTKTTTAGTILPSSDKNDDTKEIMAEIKAGKMSSSEDEQIVVFTLANQYYGVNIRVVESIIKMQSITVVPRAPQYIEGVTNLRGTVVPVVSLHTRLNIPSTEESNNKRIIIINSHGITAGLIVDEVNSVSYVLGKDIEASQTLGSIHSSFIRSIAKIEGKLIILLDLENVLKERH